MPRRYRGQTSQFGDTSIPSSEVCLLSVEEAARLEVYGVWPACKAHRHVKLREAKELVASDTHRYVGGKDTEIPFPVSMLVEHTNNANVWRTRPSGGMLGTSVRQFVPING